MSIPYVNDQMIKPRSALGGNVVTMVNAYIGETAVEAPSPDISTKIAGTVVQCACEGFARASFLDGEAVTLICSLRLPEFAPLGLLRQ